MRPRKLVVEGLRSYRQRQEITFTDGLFAITGQTGSGKSSILEAMVFALYGASTFDARNPKALLSDRCDEMTVSLEFLLRREKYQVTRCFSASGRHSMHELRGPQGEILASKSTEVDRAIEELLGLRCEDFLKTVVLPQGAFQSLLHSTPSQRTPLLKNLLGLFQLDDLAEKVATEKGRLGGLVQVGRLQRQQLPAQPQILAEELAREKAAVAAAQAQHEEHLRQITALLGLEREGRQNLAERERQLATLASLPWPAEQQWDELTAQETRLAAEEQALVTEELRLLAVQSELLEIEKHRPELDGATLRSWDKRHQSLLNRSGAHHMEAQRLDLERERLTRVQAETERLAEELAGRLAEMEQMQASQASTLERLTRARVEHARCLELQKAKANLDAQFLKAEEQAGKLAGSLLAEHEVLKGQLDAVETLAARLAVVQGELSEAERKSGLQALCSDVHGGEPCPLCDRVLPADWHMEPGDGVEEARKVVSAAQERLRQAEKAVSQSQTRLEMQTLQRDRLESEMGALRTQLVAFPENLESESQDAAAALEEAQSSHQSLAVELARVANQADAERRGWERERELLEQARRRLESDLARQAAELQDWEKLRSELCSSMGNLDWPDGVTQRLTELEDEVAALETRRRELHGQLQASQARRAAHLQERRERFERPFEEVRSTLHGTFARLDGILGAALKGPVSSWTLGEWRASATVWQGVAGDARADLELRLQEQRQQFEETRLQVQGLIAGWGGAPGQTAESHAEVLRAAVEEKRQTVWELERRITLLARDLERLGRLNQALEPAESRLAHLEAVYELLGNKAGKDKRLSFTQWVLQQRQDQLLRLASQTFQQISAGQFGFATDFQILDIGTGLERKPTTLSGGETFLASLALALSLSELVARRGGRLEAFFIDEGFGSLSPECLDRALTALEVLAQNGRMIGVISHVPLMAERIEQVWMVSKTPTGSRIEILSEELRKRMLEADFRALESANHPLFA